MAKKSGQMIWKRPSKGEREIALNWKYQPKADEPERVHSSEETSAT